MKSTTNRIALMAGLVTLPFGLTLLLLAQDLKLVQPGEKPKAGNYYSWQLLEQNPKLPPPPLPGCPFPDLLVYALDERNFVYDDREVDYAKLRAEAAEQAAAKADGQLDIAQQMAMSMESYGTTNLWLEIQPGPGSNTVTLTLHNTASGTNYAFYSRTNVASGLWTPEAFAAGADGATVATIAMDGRTNLFFIAGVGDDTDGDGLSDMEERFTQTDPGIPDTGPTGVPDGYKDPDGDGWSNLDELRNGTDPLGWNTPPAPFNVVARLTNGASNVLITWEAPPGTFLEYRIQRADASGVFQEIGRPSSGTNSFLDSGSFTNGNPMLGQPRSQYRVQTVYAGGYSQASQVTLDEDDSSLAVTASLVRGPNGRWQVALSALPSNAQYARLNWVDWFYGYDLPSALTFHDLSIDEFANRSYVLPDAEVAEHLQDVLYIQMLGSNGAAGPPFWAGVLADDAPYFVDGREHLKQNLRFVLRAAGVGEPYSVPPVGVIGTPPDDRFMFSSVLAEASFIHRDFAAKLYSHGEAWEYNRPFVAWDDLWPFRANYQLRNYMYYSGTNSSNGSFQFTWTFDYAPVPAPPVLAYANPSWIMEPADDLAQLGLSRAGGVLSMANAVTNLFGLVLGTSRVAVDRELFPGYFCCPELHDIAPGGSLQVSNAPLEYVQIQTLEPTLETVGYFFAPVMSDGTTLVGYGVWPEHQPFLSPIRPDFSVTNETALLVASIGRPLKLGGWAKQRIVNGDPTKFAYLGQYFDKAYTVATNGATTTNETGILSPYGEFLPREPGPAALVTMPDIDTGARGTAIVHVIKVQLDVNHDGVMDLSSAGPDNTSAERPFRFWINNDHDEPATEDKPERDEPLGPRPDHGYGRIRTQRNLEDFARLWIVGLPPAQGYTATLSWRSVTGSPTINLYYAHQEDGGIGYLSDTNAAAGQFTQVYFNGQLLIDYAAAVATLAPGSTYNLLFAPTTGELLFPHLLFEAAGTGSGQLVLSVLRDGQAIAESSQWVELMDNREMYEEAAVINVLQDWPQMVEQSPVSTFRLIHSPPEHAAEAGEVAVFIHGWRMTEWATWNFAETMFKRLYWQGFQGRFAALRWPTRSGLTDPFFGLDYVTYNRSEHIAFESGTGTAAYLNDLRRRFPDHTISVCAHSMGGIVAMQTLTQLAAASQRPLDNLVLMQAAVPAQCYDTNVPNFADFISLEQTVHTPDTYRHYAAGITNALRTGGSIVNFLNPADFALATWELNEGFYMDITNGPVTMKPNTPLGYYTDGTNSLLRTNYWNQSFLSIIYGGYYNGPTRSVTNLHEVMPLISRPRTKAVGAQAGVQGQIRGGEINLQSQFGFGGASSDHSGQWNRNVQDTAVGAFYFQLRRNLFPPAP